MAGAVTATVHPSAILRAPPERRGQDYEAFVADLKLVRRRIQAKTAASL
jgi:hypothetical protein